MGAYASLERQRRMVWPAWSGALVLLLMLGASPLSPCLASAALMAGRVLGAVATADTLKEAIAHAYAVADKIHFENAYMRRDIGQRALMALKGE